MKWFRKDTQMDIPALAAFAFLGGAILQGLYRRLPISMAVPIVAMSLWTVFTEFLQPSHGGGASMWPVALFFVIIYSGAAACGGAFLVVAITKMVKRK